jgi:hypothetical protein
VLAASSLPSAGHCYRIGQRLRRDEQHLGAQCEVGDREPDVRQEGAGKQRHFLLRDELGRQPDRVFRPAGVVARHDLDRPAEHAATGVRLLDRQLPSQPVRQRELRNRRVAVDLADANPVGLRQGRAQRRGQCGQRKQFAARGHRLALSSEENVAGRPNLVS